MPRLTTLKLTTYAGKTYHEGDEFDATDADAKVLIAVEHAKLAPTPSKPPAPASADPAPRKEAAPTGGDAPVSAPHNKRQYKRRDLRAEK